ncbi:hypothetical protein SAMN05443574_105289 [Haloarcula vallismortis]|uniref:Uncharacterized protein n=2 Tax=Haloarcula vallismortis TaxID=28442 RepID=M0JFS3_HALVA|nr:hypothetical protein [Haloarcula vallismortis]EMA06859.1 hypothetical protein C437_12163 [Haloarcula vallismortis ATCC 29715]SDW67436.1 hypothetical protein SAMN05443574_105289 [Haloarcula vallismortis]
MSETESQVTASMESPTEYEHLHRKQKETAGTVELAELTDVWVGESELVCRFQFDWATAPIQRRYDLNSDRDIAKIERLCEANGLQFEQASHLEGALIELEYTGSQWLPRPEAAYTDGEGATAETFRAECRLLFDELAQSPAFVRRGIERIRDLSTTQLIIGVILVKKIAIIALLAHLLL